MNFGEKNSRDSFLRNFWILRVLARWPYFELRKFFFPFLEIKQLDFGGDSFFSNKISFLDYGQRLGF